MAPIGNAMMIYLFIMSYLPRSTPSVRSTVLPGAPVSLETRAEKTGENPWRSMCWFGWIEIRRRQRFYELQSRDWAMWICVVFGGNIPLSIARSSPRKSINNRISASTQLFARLVTEAAAASSCLDSALVLEECDCDCCDTVNRAERRWKWFSRQK